MISSLLRPQKGRGGVDQSTFSSRYTAEQSSPCGTRGSRVEERRRLAADPDESEGREDDDDDDDLDVEEDDEGAEQEDEDGNVDATPLLPIFSAAHLGILFRS